MNIMHAENVKRIHPLEQAPATVPLSVVDSTLPAGIRAPSRARPFPSRFRRTVRATGFRFTREEISGSPGDLGTFLPPTLGYITRCGLSPAPVFFFAGLWNVVTGLLFRLPVPVQPMKAIAAVAIAEGMTPGSLFSSYFVPPSSRE